jgi:hypothetical protein
VGPSFSLTTWRRKSYSAGGAYVSFMMGDGQGRVKATYRDNYKRLPKFKSRYGPKKLLLNQSEY